MTKEKAAAIRFLVLDVDGVLTDGRIVLDDGGAETKAFHVRDGLGLQLLMEAGVEVALITGRNSEVVTRRAKELGIEEVHQGVKDKAAFLNALMNRKGLRKEEVCVMGDDLPDLPMFAMAGLTVTVADAAVEVGQAATLVTKNRGGMGAVREICEIILKAQMKWPQALSSFI